MKGRADRAEMMTQPMVVYLFAIVTPASPRKFMLTWAMLTGLLFMLVVLALVEMEARKPSKTISRLTTVALLVVALLVGMAGHFGGVMVHGPDYLPW